MTDSNDLSKWPLASLPGAVIWAMLSVALAGFADAAYLTVEHYQNAIPPCSVGSCETVLSSAYATVSGVPVALAGALYYLAILVLLFVFLDSRNEACLKLALALPVAGLAATLYLIYLQLFVIHAICLYCMGSAAATALLSAGSVYIFSKYSLADTLRP